MPQPEVYMLVHHLHEKSAGIAHAIFERARLFTEHGHRVRILTFDHLMDAAALTTAFHEAGRLDPRLRIENIYPLLRERAEAALPLRQRIRALRKRLRGDVDEMAEAPHRVIERDGRGIIRRVSDLGANGKPTRLRLYTSDRKVFLDLRFTEKDAWIKRAIWREGGATREFAHQDDYLAAVLDAIVGERRVVLIGDGIHQSHKLVRSTARRATRLMHLHANHLADPADPTAGWDAPLSRLLAEHSARLDGIVTMTGEQRELLVPAAACPVTAIPLPLPEARRASTPRDPHRAVLLARLAPEKAIGDAIRAFALIAPRMPEARFDIWGSGPEEERLRGAIEEHGLEDVVRLRGWCADPDEVLAGAAVLVSTSIGEGFGLTVLEAARQETPAVSFTTRFGPRDVIVDGETGMLVDERSIPGLAAAIERLLRDEDERARMGRRAAVRARERFSPDRVYAAWSRLWAEDPRPRTPEV